MKNKQPPPEYFCPFCGKEIFDADKMYCSDLCELDANEPPKLVTRRSAAIIKIAPNGDLSYHD